MRRAPLALAVRFLAPAALALVLAPACTKTAATADTTDAGPVRPAVAVSEPLFPGTGTWSRRIRTSSADAQKYFDQGLRFLYGFNHDEAIRSFQQAQAFDPQCAMCFVGEALAHGPHINNPDLDDAHRLAGLAAAEKARALAKAAGGANGAADDAGIPRALADALVKRYHAPPDHDDDEQDGDDDAGTAAAAAHTGGDPARPYEEYTRAMQALSDAHPSDADLAALAAEAYLDLHPWDQWSHEGKMKDGTSEAVALIDRGLAAAPLHPLANHLAVHVWEPSPTPERAAESAERLRTMAPALAHLVHMPTHIDVRRGRFADAVASSQRALSADAAYLARVPRQGFYRFYVAHNEHMLAYAAMMTGQKALAQQAMQRMVSDLPSDWLAENAAVADGIVALPLEVNMRFGEWDAILAAPDFDGTLPIARALRRAARAVALAAKGSPKAAREELAAFDGILATLGPENRFGNNDGRALLRVARGLALGEIEVATADQRSPRDPAALARGIRELEDAVAAEDALQYDEPPDWLQPARHTLGAVLLNAGRAKDAERVYREDLARVPGNGWGLLGLAQALEAQKRDDEAKAVRKELALVWKDADVTTETSCMCQKRHAR